MICVFTISPYLHSPLPLYSIPPYPSIPYPLSFTLPLTPILLSLPPYLKPFPRLRIFDEGVQACEKGDDNSMNAVAVAFAEDIGLDDRHYMTACKIDRADLRPRL